MRILVVEDEVHLNQLLVKTLQENHYAVDSCTDGEEAISYLEAATFDLVLLDIMLPKVDGLQILKHIRKKECATMVILLTAKDSISDRVKGLDYGADDYLVKPFAFDELLARIRALVRRPAGRVSNIYQLEDLVVNIETHQVTRGGKEIALSSKEFAILEYLIRNKGMVLSREQMEQNAWDFSFEGGSNIVDVYIRYLRRKIDDGFRTKLIHTVRGVGYVLKVDTLHQEKETVDKA